LTILLRMIKIKMIVDKIKKSNRSLILTGKSGTGKTHLAIAKAKSFEPIYSPEVDRKNHWQLAENSLKEAKQNFEKGYSYGRYEGNDLLKYIEGFEKIY
jgi:chromosomal replication initiation ATPase DnaA